MKEEYFDAVDRGYMAALFKNAGHTVRVALSEGYQPTPVFEEIVQEYAGNASFATPIIHGYLQAIFSKFLQLSEAKARQGNVPPNLYERFSKLLLDKCSELHYVNEYAALLHTTPQNLNAACRKHLGESAGEMIASQLMLYAKRYLYHTDKTIGEIAQLLHFNDPSYFIRFFKKKEGVTPGQFRERHFQ